MSKAAGLLNSIAAGMDPTSKLHSPSPQRPRGGKPLPGASDNDADGDDNMAADHQMGPGEHFGIDELEGKICKDCHDTVKRVLGHKGATRGEHE